MSYPHEIRTLIIEDDTDTIETYRELFRDRLRRRFPQLAEPCFQESYGAAEQELRRPHIYHMIILDLALPQVIGGPDDVGASGLGLIPAIRDREDYPVPVLMIVTAKPDRIRNSPALMEQLSSAFWQSCVIPKNDNLMEQLVWGVEAAIKYSSIGVHLVGDETAERLWPMLSPREEDLVRRFVLGHSTAVGVDLRWWSVERDALRAGAPAWAKVLHGKIMFAGHEGYSRERFFKFVDAAEGDVVRKSAELLSNKLQHAQLLKWCTVGSRSLLVTDKAGPTDAPVLPLRTAIQQNKIPVAQLERVTQDIVDQLCMLGEPQEATVTLRRILWADHDETRLADGWSRIRADGSTDPLDLFRELRERPERVVVTRRLGHGDLHPGNVAIGEDAGTLRAYVIDAGAMTTEVWAKDIAVLEVSTLLHVDFGGAASLADAMPSLFDGTDPYAESADWSTLEERFVLPLKMIVGLRSRIREACDQGTYVVLLLDYLLVQIGGVSFGTTYNKIVSLSNVASAFECIVSWYRRLYPSATAE